MRYVQQPNCRGVQRLAYALAGAVVVVIGCGRPGSTVAPVNGRVLLDGQPLTQGRVVTAPSAGRGASGVIQPDGSFELRTSDGLIGALIGTHKVAVVAYEGTGASGPEANYGKLLVPQRYVTPETSGLEIEVKADGDNAPVLKLTSP